MGAYAASLERPSASALLHSGTPAAKRNCQCGGNAHAGGECAECSGARASANGLWSHELTTVLQRHESALAKAQSPGPPTATELDAGAPEAMAKLGKIDVSV